ncbi:MAG: GNAT family N-acetyltransferase [Bacillota bacterium]|nr:GNAT family N-acetyltransferase [Bacillota bacterium]
MEKIETNRLILREFRESDYDDLFEFLFQLKDDEFEGYPGITYENGREHLAYRVGSEEFYAIELKESGRVIGNVYCGIRNSGVREVGYIINENHRRKGFGCEALSALVEDVLEKGAHEIYARCDPRNIRSWKLLEKAGFERQADLRKYQCFYTDEHGAPIWKDTFVYAIVKKQESSSHQKT